MHCHPALTSQSISWVSPCAIIECVWSSTIMNLHESAFHYREGWGSWVLETVYSLSGSSPSSHSIITTLARSYIKHRREDLEDGHFAACLPSPVLLTQLAGISSQRCLIITGLVIIVGMAKRHYKNVSSMWLVSKEHKHGAKTQTWVDV